MANYICPLCGKRVLQGEYIYGVCANCAKLAIDSALKETPLLKAIASKWK